MIRTEQIERSADARTDLEGSSTAMIDRGSCCQSSLSQKVISRKENTIHRMRATMWSWSFGRREIWARAQATWVILRYPR